MKAILSPAVEVEYDFVLNFIDRECPYKVGSEVKSPVTDDYKTTHFTGFGIVEAVTATHPYRGEREETAYVRQFRPIS